LCDKKEGIGGGGEVFAAADFEGGPKLFDGVKIRRVSRQKEQVTTRSLDHFKRGRGLMKAGVVQQDHAAGRQHREIIFKTGKANHRDEFTRQAFAEAIGKHHA
jgi:hypothetical protein